MFCEDFTAIVDHLISHCQVLTPNEFKNRHDRTGQNLHRKLSNPYQLSRLDNWFEHHPQQVVEGNNVTTLCNFPIHTNPTIQANRPDIIVQRAKRKPVPYLVRVFQQTKMSLLRNSITSDLEIEKSRIWNLKAVTVPVILVTLGTAKRLSKSS